MRTTESGDARFCNGCGAPLAAARTGGSTRRSRSLDERPGPRFLEAALQIDAGRFAAAAATLREIGTPQLEAEVLVLAARGGTGTAVGRARELLRGLGADARLRELDAEATEVSSRSGGS